MRDETLYVTDEDSIQILTCGREAPSPYASYTQNIPVREIYALGRQCGRPRSCRARGCQHDPDGSNHLNDWQQHSLGLQAVRLSCSGQRHLSRSSWSRSSSLRWSARNTLKEEAQRPKSGEIGAAPARMRCACTFGGRWLSKMLVHYRTLEIERDSQSRQSRAYRQEARVSSARLEPRRN